MKHAAVLVGGLLLLAGPYVSSQETTGGIVGTVSDEIGAPIAGASVEASGPLGEFSTTSDGTGRYRFPRLPPGTYTVTASSSDLMPVEAEDVLVVLGEAITVEFTLAMGAFEDEITVYSDTVAIDFSESQTATSIRQWEIDYLPRGRDYTDVVSWGAGIVEDNQAGGISVDGASGLENRYVIDGIDTTDPERVTALTTPPRAPPCSAA